MRTVVAGDTKPMDFTLYDGDGASRVAIDGTGLTLALDLRDRNGASVPTSGKVAWLVQASGTARVSLAAGDLTAARGPFTARFKVTDQSGKVASYPTTREGDQWLVVD